LEQSLAQSAIERNNNFFQFGKSEYYKKLSEDSSYIDHMRKQVCLFFAILPDKKPADECSSKRKATSSSASKSVTSSISCVQKIIDIENKVIDDPESYYDKNFQPYFQDSLKGYFLKEVDDYLKQCL